MDFDDQFQLEHLFLTERRCRACGKMKDLIDGFYLTRKGRGNRSSAYSYECKICTVKRITESRKKGFLRNSWQYPDW